MRAKAADLLADIGKTLLILGHDIPQDILAVVQIAGEIVQLPAGLFYLLQGKISAFLARIASNAFAQGLNRLLSGPCQPLGAAQPDSHLAF